MKKRYLLIIIACFFLLNPQQVRAVETTKKFYSNIDIETDGSVKVKELFELSGNYNGLRRIINYKNSNAKEFSGSVSDLEGSSIYNGSGITDLQVSSVSNSNLTFNSLNEAVNYFTLVNYANKGEGGVYTREDTSNGVSLLVYNPSSKNEAFYLSYTIPNVIVVHNDIAEYAFNIFGSEYEENIKDFRVQVNLPGEDSDFRAWLHGPLNGYMERTDNKTAVATSDFVGAYNPVSIRILFNKDLVPNATKFSGMTAKEDIIKYQTKLADEANATREKIARENNTVKIITVIWYVVTLLLSILTIKKTKDSKKTDFVMEYYRDFPGDYGPEVLEYLLSKNVTEKSLSATILNLIYKKVLKVEPTDMDKKNYRLIFQKDSNVVLTKAEEAAKKMFIDRIGNGESVELSKIKSYCSKELNARNIMNLYNDFVKEGVNLGKAEGYYDKMPKVQVIAIIVSLLGFLIMLLGIQLEVDFLPATIAGIIGLINMIILAFQKTYTKKGAKEYKMWMAHKKFLEDFSRFDEKELLEVPFWDKYLVYATVLGCADKLSKQMKIKMATMSENGTNPYPYYMYNNDFTYIGYAVSNSISNSVNQAISSSRSSIAASSSSSGDGFSGGSIGGGGSFGGGGGGGRF